MIITWSQATVSLISELHRSLRSWSGCCTGNYRTLEHKPDANTQIPDSIRTKEKRNHTACTRCTYFRGHWWNEMNSCTVKRSTDEYEPSANSNNHEHIHETFHEPWFLNFKGYLGCELTGCTKKYSADEYGPSAKSENHEHIASARIWNVPWTLIS